MVARNGFVLQGTFKTFQLNHPASENLQKVRDQLRLTIYVANTSHLQDSIGNPRYSAILDTIESFVHHKTTARTWF